MTKKNQISRERFSQLYYYRDLKCFYDFFAELSGAILESVTNIEGIKKRLNHHPKNGRGGSDEINRYTLIDAFPPQKVIALLESSQNQQCFTSHTIVAAQALSCQILKGVFNSQNSDKLSLSTASFMNKIPVNKTLFTGFNEALSLYDKQKGWLRRLFGPSKSMRLLKTASEVYEKFYGNGGSLKKRCLASKLILNNKSEHDPRFKIVCNTIRCLMQTASLKKGTASYSAVCQLIIAAKKTLEIQGTNDLLAASKAVNSLRAYYSKPTTKNPTSTRCAIYEIGSLLSNTPVSTINCVNSLS